jgi:tRNA-dihydrouridine synthase B
MSGISVGNLRLANRIFFAPLAGCSDLAYRQMARKWKRPGIDFCEMVKIDALVRHDPQTYKLLRYTQDMHPIGAQLCGSKPEYVKQAAEIIEDLGFDLLDFNCGCPVDKVTKDGSGSGMLKTPQLIGEMITVKIRTGWDENHINAVQITQLAEAAGAKAITIHGRTREQGYKGLANRDIIKECKEAARDILVIGNGDIFDPESANHMFNHTNCDAILVARGAMGNPWIVEDILDFFEGLEVKNKTSEEIKNAMLLHFDLITKVQPEKRALLDMRRVGNWYLRLLEGVKSLRIDLNKSFSTSQSVQLVESFNWEDTSLAQANPLETSEDQ